MSSIVANCAENASLGPTTYDVIGMNNIGASRTMPRLADSSLMVWISIYLKHNADGVSEHMSKPLCTRGPYTRFV